MSAGLLAARLVLAAVFCASGVPKFGDRTGSRATAAAFGVPHATLGEDVASAVVLRANAATTPKEIRRFAAARLAEFKVPRQVLLVDALPKSATGKVQRAGMAAKFGITATPQTFVAPRTAVEEDRRQGRAIQDEFARRHGFADIADYEAAGGSIIDVIRGIPSVEAAPGFASAAEAVAMAMRAIEASVQSASA